MSSHRVPLAVSNTGAVATIFELLLDLKIIPSSVLAGLSEAEVGKAQTKNLDFPHTLHVLLEL